MLIEGIMLVVGIIVGAATMFLMDRVYIQQLYSKNENLQQERDWAIGLLRSDEDHHLVEVSEEMLRAAITDAGPVREEYRHKDDS